jgi:hypothetical protein
VIRSRDLGVVLVIGDPGGQEATMKRLAIGFGLVLALALPGSALAFHHGGLPSTDCAAAAAGSPSNNNGEAKVALQAHNDVFDIPPGLPPVGTPGNGQGEGGEFCANGE